jgi:hypothetical protein
MEDKLIKILGRYISKVYPELLFGNIVFSEVFGNYYSNIDSINILNISPGKYVLSIDPNSNYKSLVDSFGEDLFLVWFNGEHYITFIDLLGDRVRGKRFIIDGLSFYI